jgi:cAMP-dependent protein kinase regulator
VDPTRLVTIPLFAELTDAERGYLAAIAGEAEVEEGTAIVNKGDFGYAMFAVEAGTADVLHDGDVLRTLRRGDVFGEIAVLTSGRRTATVVATSPMRLITFFNRDVWRLEEELPEVATALRGQITRRLDLAVDGS